MLSTAIRSLDYDQDTATLTVEFPDAKRYRYADVSIDDLTELVMAPSMGDYFNRNIRNFHTATRVDRTGA